jgi:phage protein D
MPDTRLLIELDGDAVADDDLHALVDIQVEEATRDADAATLTANLVPSADGEWTSLLDVLVAPRTPLAVQIGRGDVVYRFEGLSTEASWSIDADGASTLTIKALDLTLGLDLEEKIVAWPGMSESAIAEAIFSAHGLTARAEATPDGPDADVHVLIQRSTDWAFLRSLAARWGYVAYLEWADGRTTGHFGPLDPLQDPQGELALGFGGDALRVQAQAQLVSGEKVLAQRIPPLSDAPQSGEAQGEDEAQGSTSLAGQAVVLLAPDDVDGELEPLAAVTGRAHESAFAARLSVEIDTAGAGILMRAKRTVLVKGLGSSLSGLYLVESVRHVLSVDGHRQQIELTRNALGLTGDEAFGGGGGLLP